MSQWTEDEGSAALAVPLLLPVNRGPATDGSHELQPCPGAHAGCCYPTAPLYNMPVLGIDVDVSGTNTPGPGLQ